MHSIFQRANPAIAKLFAEAGKPEKVMCVPIDYAKRQHTALVCNGAGKQLHGVFHIHNNPEGVEFLDDLVGGLCRKHSIRKGHVFFGGEDCSAIAFSASADPPVAEISSTLWSRRATWASDSTPAIRPRSARIRSPAPTSSTCWASRRY